MDVKLMSVLAGSLGALIVVFIYQITRTGRVDISGRTGSKSRYAHSSSGFGRFYENGLNRIIPESTAVKFAGLTGCNMDLIQSQIEALGIQESITAIEVAVMKVLGVLCVLLSAAGFVLTENLYILIGLLSVGAALYMLPEARIKEMLAEQKSSMEAQLPLFIEQTYLCIAAGSTIQDALKYVAENTDGVLGLRVRQAFINSMYGARWSDELIKIASDLRLGAFEDFVNDIVVADATGVNIEETLKEEVEHINRINRARVMGEIKALEAKLSPMQIVLCMVPMMGIIMLPIVVQIIETL